MDSVDAVVIGAGVVGLAVGRALARSGLETIVLERANAIGTGTSSRNSEVIHAGLYYPRGFAEGAAVRARPRRSSTPFCESHGVAHRRCGKLMVATSAQQHAALQAIASAGGGQRRRRWPGSMPPTARALEPALRCTAALLSPETGIVDSHGLMLALQGDLESAGGALALQSPVLGLQCGAGAPRARGRRRDADGAVGTHRRQRGGPVGAGARRRRSVACLRRSCRRRFQAKGNYFSLAGRAPFSHLIYPVPEQAGLGVHLTLDLAGQARFGPDVQWLDAGDRPTASTTASMPSRADSFLCRDPPLLAGPAATRAAAGLQRRAAQAAGAGRCRREDFVLQGPARARRRRA